MGNVFIYDAQETDFSTLGLCGELVPTSVMFHEIANGNSTVTLEHPMDPMGRYRFLAEDRILKVDVPVRTTPEISGDEYVASVQKWVVRNTATKANRYIYNGKDPSKHKNKLKLAAIGAEVVVVATFADDNYRWKVKYTYPVKKNSTKYKTVTGYMAHDSTTLEHKEDVVIPATSDGIETVAPSWTVKEQLFRIYSVEKTEDSITAEARHISYDLLYNLTTYDYNKAKTLQDAADEMLDACFDEHSFSVQTNITGERTGFHYADKDPITALLDPDIGLVPRWDGQLIRDNYNLTILHQAGVNRGVLLTYGKNLAGVQMSIDLSSLATAIRPIGEDENGKPLYLDKSYILNAQYEPTAIQGDNRGIVFGPYHYLDGSVVRCTLPFARIFPLEGDDCKVDKKNGPGTSVVLKRLLDQSIAKLQNGGSTPELSVSIDLAMLGYTEQWSLYQSLLPVYLYDTIGVRHARMGIDIEATVNEIEWDCLLDKLVRATLGTISDITPSVASWQISSVNGSKLISGSVGSGALGSGCVSERHIQAESVNAEAIQAESLTAETAVVQQLNTMSLEALEAKLNSVTAQTIVTDTLAAAVANLMHVAAQDIEAGRISTDQLAAVLANLVTVQAKVGTFDLSTVQNLVSSALTLQRGQANSMYITNLAVTSANLLNVTVGKLVIKGEDGSYYEVGVGADGVIRTSQYDATAAEISAGVTTDGRQIVEETINAQTITGKYVSAEEATFNRVLAAALEAGKITASEALLASASIPMLYVTSIKSLGDTIDISANETIKLQAGRMNSMAMLDDEGLHVGRAVLDEDGNYQIDEDGNPIFSTKEVLIREESVDIREAGKKFSRFAGDYVQFGNYQLRKSTDGGLVFKMKEE